MKTITLENTQHDTDPLWQEMEHISHTWIEKSNQTHKKLKPKPAVLKKQAQVSLWEAIEANDLNEIELLLENQMSPDTVKPHTKKKAA